jgi:hypothetical protein
MLIDVQRMLRQAFQTLKAERDRIDRQIAALEAILRPDGARPGGAALRRKGMTPEARKALSRRMKAYWRKRRVGAARKSRRVQKPARK